MPKAESTDYVYVPYMTRRMRKDLRDRIRLMAARRKAQDAKMNRMEDVMNQALAVGLALLEKRELQGD